MLEIKPRSINNGLKKLYNESKGKKLENMLKIGKYETDITWGIEMLEKASGCVHLPNPETTNKDAAEQK